jgi:hypothetical protein
MVRSGQCPESYRESKCIKTWLPVVVLLLSAFVYAEDVVEDKILLKDVQKALIDTGFAVQVKFPVIIYYKIPPSHFKAGWAGVCNVSKGQIEILITGDTEFDMNTFYHECFHWFVLSDKEWAAWKFANICERWFKGKVVQSLRATSIKGN